MNNLPAWSSPSALCKVYISSWFYLFQFFFPQDFSNSFYVCVKQEYSSYSRHDRYMWSAQPGSNLNWIPMGKCFKILANQKMTTIQLLPLRFVEVDCLQFELLCLIFWDHGWWYIDLQVLGWCSIVQLCKLPAQSLIKCWSHASLIVSLKTE